MVGIAATGNLETVTLLVGAGADVTAVNSKGLTALYAPHLFLTTPPSPYCSLIGITPLQKVMFP